MDVVAPVPIGVIPAAGSARRLGVRGASKEALVLDWRLEAGALRARSAFGRLLESFRRAGLEETWIGLRAGKWDVVERLADEPEPPRRVWRVLEPTASVPETLTATLAGREDSRVLLGFPDLLFSPLDAARDLVERIGRADAPDAVLAAVPGDRPEKCDMLDVDGEGRITRYAIKDPVGATMPWTWVLAAWGPRFGAFLGRFAAAPPDLGREAHVGDVVRAALEAGLDVRARTRAEGATLDVGTPEDFARAPAWLQEHPT